MLGWKSRFAFTLLIATWFGGVNAQAQDLKTIIRAVSSGTLSIDELGELNPFFKGFQSIASYEDEDVYLSLGENQAHELVIFAWTKGKRVLTLNSATERWAEARLGDVKSEEELESWKDFRALLRGAVLSVSEEQRPLQAVAFVDDYALVGDVGVDSVLPSSPVGFRFVKGPRSGEFLL